MSIDKPLNHAQYLRLVRKQRRARHRADHQSPRDPHGLYTFCLVAVIVILALIGFGLLWQVTS